MTSKKIKTLKVPTKAVIFFSLLLTLTSFYSGLAYNKLQKSSSTNTAIAEAKATLNLEKSKKPQLQFFVMSFCPYGNQMENLLRPVFDLIGSKAEIKPQYIFQKIEDLPAYCQPKAGDPTQCTAYIENGYFKTVSECQQAISQNLTKCTDESAYIKASNGAYYASLHGRVEANQNIREICAWNLADNKVNWWDFVNNVNTNCTDKNADTCWQEQAKKANLDADKITQCFNKEAIDLIEKEIALTDQYQISSSPTLLINNSHFPPESAYNQSGDGSLKIGKDIFNQNQYRSPNVIKEAICSAFNKAPKECLEELAPPATKPAEGGC